MQLTHAQEGVPGHGETTAWAASSSTSHAPGALPGSVVAVSEAAERAGTQQGALPASQSADISAEDGTGSGGAQQGGASEDKLGQKRKRAPSKAASGKASIGGVAATAGLTGNNAAAADALVLVALPNSVGRCKLTLASKVLSSKFNPR